MCILLSGITTTENMDWGQHISDILSKATKTSDFIGRNLIFAPKSTKEVAYKTSVCFKLKYEITYLEHLLAERVQRMTAR